MMAPQGEGSRDPLAATMDSADSLDDELLRRNLKAKLFGRAATVEVGRYRIERRIGRGGMGVVYEAFDPELDRKVALKLLLPGRTAGRERMMREARAMARLSHPNVVTVHEVGTHDERVFVAMEFVHGPTLRDWLQTRPSVPQISSVFHQAAIGLDAAHRVGLVHRDFKPENVLIGDDGWVKVVDFGLARAGTDLPALPPAFARMDRAALDERLTRTGHLLGTPAYMPPEQFLGQVVGIGSDVFSFCVVFHEALTGRRPFEGRTSLEIFERASSGEVPALDARDVPPPVASLIEQGLRSDPAQRLQSLRPFIEVLGARPSRTGKEGIIAGGAGAALMLLTVVGGIVGYATYSSMVDREPDGEPVRDDGPQTASERSHSDEPNSGESKRRLRQGATCVEYVPSPSRAEKRDVDTALGRVNSMALEESGAGPVIVSAAKTLLDADRPRDACGVLGRYLTATGAHRLDEARCLFAHNCAEPRDVWCPEGARQLGTAGCVWPGCSAVDDTAASDACSAGDISCCGAAAAALEDPLEVIAVHHLGCEGGSALACTAAARAAEQESWIVQPVHYWTRACQLGRVQSCRWVSPDGPQGDNLHSRCLVSTTSEECPFLVTDRSQLQYMAAHQSVRWEIPAVLRGASLRDVASDAGFSPEELEGLEQVAERYRSEVKRTFEKFRREIVGEPVGPGEGGGLPWDWVLLHSIDDAIEADPRWGPELVSAVYQRVADERAKIAQPPSDPGIAEAFIRFELNLGWMLEDMIAQEFDRDRARSLHAQRDGWPGTKLSETLNAPR